MKMTRVIVAGLALCAGHVSVFAAASETVAAAVTDCTQNEELYFANRRLMDVEDLALTCFQKFGGSFDERAYTWSAGPLAANVPTFFDSGLYLLANDGATLTVEFHGRTYGRSYNGVGNGFCLKLTQKGDDIYGQVVWYVGATEMNDIFTSTWAGKKKSSWGDFNNRDALYSTGGHDLNIQFSLAASVPRTVQFVGFDGTDLATVEVPAGTYGVTPPTPPEIEGFRFWKWDADLSYIRESQTVQALYRQLFTVVFKDADGTELSRQEVEEGLAATEPDMTGKENFVGWSVAFDAVTSDLVVQAVYGAVPEAVTKAVATGVLDELDNVLIWVEEQGEWTAEARNWYTKTGQAKAWIPGSTAVFPLSAQVAVRGTQVVGRLLALAEAERVAFAGDALDLAAPAKIDFSTDAVFRFDNTLVGTAGCTVDLLDPVRLHTFAQPVPAEAAELAFPGQTLADLATLQLHVFSNWGGNKADLTLTSFKAPGETGDGFYRWSLAENGQVATVQAHWICSGYPYALHLVLTQGADGVYARVGQAYYWYKPAADYWGCDLLDEGGNYRTDGVVKYYTEAEPPPDTFKVTTRSLAATFAKSPTTFAVEIGGDYAVDGTLALDVGTFKTVDEGVLGGGTFTAPVALADGTVLEYASAAAQVVKADVKASGSGCVRTTGTGELRFTGGCAGKNLQVANAAYAEGYGTLAQDDPGTTVQPGGVLSVGSFNGYWGPASQSGPVTVLTNGLVVLTKPQGLGCLKPWILQGGALRNDSTDDQLLYKFYMRDGAAFTGAGVRVGFTSYYEQWSFINVSGSKPSTFDAEKITIGYQVPAADKKYVGVKFIVDDVTGDDGTDFFVRSPIVERTDKALYDEGFRDNVGVWKQGPGTLELSAPDAACASGVFKLEAGTVRFAETAGGAYGALVLLGSATLDVARGMHVSFADASDQAWADGALLTITGDLAGRALRVGVNDKALTESQLDAIKYLSPKGKLLPVLLDKDGYLRRPPSNLTIILR